MAVVGGSITTIAGIGTVVTETAIDIAIMIGIVTTAAKIDRGVSIRFGGEGQQHIPSHAA